MDTNDWVVAGLATRTVLNRQERERNAALRMQMQNDLVCALIAQGRPIEDAVREAVAYLDQQAALPQQPAQRSEWANLFWGVIGLATIGIVVWVVILGVIGMFSG